VPVTISGLGMTYDAGLPVTGTVKSIIITLGATQMLTWTGLTFSAAQFSALAFAASPDPVALETALLSGDDVLLGGPGNGQLHGQAGNDTLHGQAGDDWLYGGAGRDRYFGDDGTDGVTFAWGEAGQHGVRLDLTRTTGQIRDDGYGNIETATGVENWEGSAQSDTLIGGDQYETLWGQAGSDIIRGGGNSDWLYGNDGNDSLFGDAGVDLLNGGAGRDQYDGGADGDILTLSVDEGTTTGAEIDLRLATGNIVNDGFGNTETALNVENYEGTALGDLFHARDTVAPGGQPDVLRGLAGNDTLIGGAVSAVLNGNDGNDLLQGGSGYETLAGGAGADTYDGGAGRDMLDLWLDGFAGHGDVVDLTAAVQIVDDGYGNAETAVGIENLSLSNSADRATGNTGANMIYGNEGNDTLLGGGGVDTLIGGSGSDRLTGGFGADQFQFSGDVNQAGVDVITDMRTGQDKIAIEAGWGLGFGTLTADSFASGAGLTAASTGLQRVIYNTTTGDLYIDADGSGSTAAVLIAQLSGHPTLVFSDIFGW